MMKSIKVVTNNERAAECIKHPLLLDFIDGDVRAVVFRTRDLLMEGWRLTADPLGGRRERANPFLTVILEGEEADFGCLPGTQGRAGSKGQMPGSGGWTPGSGGRMPGPGGWTPGLRGRMPGSGGLVGSAGISGNSGEILRVEQLLSIFERSEERLARLDQRQLGDYAALDVSLARSVLDKVV